MLLRYNNNCSGEWSSICDEYFVTFYAYFKLNEFHAAPLNNISQDKVIWLCNKLNYDVIKISYTLYAVIRENNIVAS